MQKQPSISNHHDIPCSSIGKRSTIATSSTSKSSCRSLKLLAAEAEYRAAQLKAKQDIERTEEETCFAIQKSRIACRKVERELHVASVQLSIWKESAVSKKTT